MAEPVEPALFAGRWPPERSGPSLSADEVVRKQVVLRESMANVTMRKQVSHVFEAVIEAAAAQGGKREVAKAVSSLFYPAGSGGELAQQLSHELFQARTYQVTAEMVEEVTSTYRKSASLTGYFAEDEIPYEAGFVYLDAPLVLVDGQGRQVTHRVISWSTQPYVVPVNGIEVLQTAIRMTAWHDLQDTDDLSHDEETSLLRALGTSLVLSHTQLTPIGSKYGGRREGEFDDFMPEDFAHWVHVLWIYMEAELSVTRQEPLSRPAWRRARGLKAAPKTVNVITLRRTVVDDEEGPGGSRDVAWTCQWWVNSHYRHLGKYDQAKHHAVPDSVDRGVCAVCAVKITSVRPHWQGPDGLPRRATSQLYRLSR